MIEYQSFWFDQCRERDARIAELEAERDDWSRSALRAHVAELEAEKDELLDELQNWRIERAGLRACIADLEAELAEGRRLGAASLIETDEQAARLVDAEAAFGRASYFIPAAKQAEWLREAGIDIDSLGEDR